MSLDTLLALFPDNTSGQISAADVRAVVSGLWDEPTFTPEGFGAVGDDSTDDTSSLQDALDAVAAAGGGTVRLAADTTYRITAALDVPSKCILVGSGGSVIRQATWGRQALDVYAAGAGRTDVLIADLAIVSTETRSTIATGAGYRGDADCTRAAAVWLSGHRCNVRNVRASGFVVGVYVSGYGLDDKALSNSVTGLRVDTVDFGVLGYLTENTHIENLSGSTVSSQPSTPAHLVYLTGSAAGQNLNPVISNISGWDVLTGHVVQLKFTLGGVVSNVLADGCAGAMNLLDVQEMGISNVVSRNNLDMTTAEQGDVGGFTMQNSGEARNTIRGVLVEMGATGRAVSIGGTANRVSDLHTVSAWSAATDSYDIQITGTNNVVAGVSTVATTRSRAIGCTAGSGHRVSGVTARNARSVVDVASGVTGCRVSLDPAQVEWDVAGNYAAVNGQADTVLSRGVGCQRRFSINSGSPTLRIDPTAHDSTVADIEDSSNVTVAAPLSKANGLTFWLVFENNSGGAMGTVSWNAIFEVGAFTGPANGARSSICFTYDSDRGKWVELVRSA